MSSKRWYHSPCVKTPYNTFHRKRQVKGDMFILPILPKQHKVVQDRVAPAPKERGCYTDKMMVFQMVKWFCGKLYSTSHIRPFMPRGFTYEILCESELLDNFIHERIVRQRYVPFTRWYPDGDWWTTLLVDICDGHRMEYRAGQPQFVGNVGTVYHDCHV